MSITVLFLYAQTVLAQSAQKSVYPLYGTLKTTQFVRFEYAAKQNRALERMADQLSALLRLPSPIGLSLQECGQANAFFQSRTIVICYDLLEDIGKRASRDYTDPVVVNRLEGGAFTFTLFHELGHALIQIQNLLITGREEDVAAQISTYLLLKASANIAIDAIEGGVWFF